MKKFITLLLLCLTGMAAWAADIENVALKTDAGSYLAGTSDAIAMSSTAQNFTIKPVTDGAGACQLLNTDLGCWVNSGSNGFLSYAAQSQTNNARHFYFYEVLTSNSTSVTVSLSATPAAGKKYVILVKNENGGTTSGFYAIYGQWASGKTNRLDVVNKYGDTAPTMFSLSTSNESSNGPIDIAKVVWTVEQLAAPEPPVDVTKTYYLKDTGINQYVVMPSATGSSANITPSTTDKTAVKFAAVSGGFSIQDANTGNYIGIDTSWNTISTTTAQPWAIAKVEGGITIKTTSGDYSGKYFGGQDGKTKFYNNNGSPIVFSLEEVAPATKKCPICSEPVDIDATKCPNCGYVFESAPASGVTNLNATFSNTGTSWTGVNISVAATDADGNAVSGVTATVNDPITAPKTVGSPGTNCIVINKNSKDMNNEPLNFTISGLPAGSKFNRINLPMYAITGGGGFQQNAGQSDVTFKVTVIEGSSTLYENTITNFNVPQIQKGNLNDLLVYECGEDIVTSGGDVQVNFSISKGAVNDGMCMAFQSLKLYYLSTVEYTVHVSGATGGGVSYDGVAYNDGDKFTATGLTETALTATPVDGYETSVEIVDASVNVTYVKALINVNKTYYLQSDDVSAMYVYIPATGNAVLSTTRKSEIQFEKVSTGVYAIKGEGKYIGASEWNAIPATSAFGWTVEEVEDGVFTFYQKVAERATTGEKYYGYLGTDAAKLLSAEATLYSNKGASDPHKFILVELSLEEIKANALAALEQTKPGVVGYKTMANYETAVATINDATSKEEIEAAVAAYNATTDITMPEEGKAYVFKLAVPGYPSTWMLRNNNGNLTATAATTEYDNSHKFVAHKLADGQYEFTTPDGKYLKYRGLTDSNSNANVTTTNLQSTYSNEAGTFLLYYAKRDAGSTSTGTTILNVNSGAFDNWTAGSTGTRTDYCNMWYVEEVEDPKIVMDVTYTIIHDGEELGTWTVQEIKGEAPTGLPKYVSSTDLPDIIEENAYTIHTSYNDNMPFEIGKIYEMTIIGGGVKYWIFANGGYDTAKENTEFLDEEDYMWTVSGDWVNGFAFKNLSDYYIAAAKSNPSNGDGTVATTTLSDLCYFNIVDNGGTLDYRYRPHGGSNYIAHTSGTSKNLSFFDYYGRDSKYNTGNQLVFTEYVPAGLEITIGTTGYATFYDEVDRVIPEDVTAYYCEESAPGYLKPVEITTGVIPAYVGVVLEGTPGNYVLNEGDGTAEYIVGCLDGTTEDFGTQELIDMYYELNNKVTPTIYVFSKKDDVLGFYKYVGTTLGAHKAFYVTVPEAGVNGFILDFEGTEGINSVISATNLKAGYDIQGRRINKIQKGINILNGKKIIK